jgi:YgiT-type zinc finger domain-containing protein
MINEYYMLSLDLVTQNYGWLLHINRNRPDGQKILKSGGISMSEKCFFCKGELANDFSNYMVDLEGHFIIIKNVPCHKCMQCGEVSYSGETVERIEQIISKLKDVLTEVAIVDFAA